MKYGKLPLSRASAHLHLRGDAKYHLLWGVNKGLLFPGSPYPSYPLQYGLVPLQVKKLSKGELSQPYTLIELENVEQRTGVILDAQEVTEVGSDKLSFGSSDLVTSRLRPNLGKTILNNPNEAWAGTTEWIPLRVNRDILLPEFLKYVLLSPRYIDNAVGLLSGKQHPRISEDNLLQLRIPFPPIGIQRRIVKEVMALEDATNKAREQIGQPASHIINEILCAAFEYPLAEHKARERQTTFNNKLSRFGRAVSLRGSARYHHPDRALLDAFFARTPHEPVKAFISVPIRLGATLSQGDLDEDGECCYVHPSAVRHQGYINAADCLRVNELFYEANKRRFALQSGDVIINRSGEAAGKIAIFDVETEAICSDFTMRVRFSQKMNPVFAWYYFRSTMFQQQIDAEKQGMSLPNVFPSQIGAMLVPRCPRCTQDELAAQITAALDAVQKQRDAIEEQRQEITRLIDAALVPDTTL